MAGFASEALRCLCMEAAANFPLVVTPPPTPLASLPCAGCPLVREVLELRLRANYWESCFRRAKEREEARQQEVEIETDVPAGAVEADVDAGQLCTVLVNLCINALDVMPQGGKLTLSPRRSADGASGCLASTSSWAFSISLSMRSSALTPRPLRPETSTYGRSRSSGVSSIPSSTQVRGDSATIS